MKILAALVLAGLLAGCAEAPTLHWSQSDKMSEYSGVVRLICSFPCARWQLSAGQRADLPHADLNNQHWPNFPEN